MESHIKLCSCYQITKAAYKYIVAIIKQDEKLKKVIVLTKFYKQLLNLCHAKFEKFMEKVMENHGILTFEKSMKQPT